MGYFRTDPCLTQHSVQISLFLAYGNGIKYTVYPGRVMPNGDIALCLKSRYLITYNPHLLARPNAVITLLNVLLFNIIHPVFFCYHYLAN